MDEKIRDIFNRRIGLILDKRKDDATIAVNKIKAEASASGMLRSSRSALVIRTAYENIYEEICNQAWSELHHIAVTIGINPDERMMGELRGIFDDVLLQLANRYLAALQGENTIIDNMRDRILKDTRHAFERAREMIGTEIELFSSNTAMIMSESSSPTYQQMYNFSGPVGAVQSGENSNASITQNINTDGLEDLRGALGALLDKFDGHEQLVPLISEARTEAAKPQPVWNKLYGYFSGIRAFVGMIKEGKELLTNAEEAAVACGMDKLPPLGF